MESQYLTIEQAAERLIVNPRTVRRRIAEGALPAYRMGPRQIRVRRVDVDALLRPIPSAS